MDAYSANTDLQQPRKWLVAISHAHQVMARAQVPDRLANAAVLRRHRPQIYIDASGTDLIVELSRTVELEDRRDLTSYVEIQLGASEWTVRPFVGRLDEGEDIVWRGAEKVGRGDATLDNDLIAAANASIDAMLTFDADVTLLNAD